MSTQHEIIPCKAIIFDMDGLLLDSETLSYKTYVETADRYGITAGSDSYSRMIGLNMIEGLTCWDILPARIDATIFKAEWVAEYRERLAGTVPVKPGVVDVINRLAARNIPMAVATSSQGEKARDVLDRAGGTYAGNHRRQRSRTRQTSTGCLFRQH